MMYPMSMANPPVTYTAEYVTDHGSGDAPSPGVT
jgi:hypothetical protein